MRKTSAVVFCVITFLLLAGATIIENQAHPVLINGKPFSNAVTLNGNLYVPLEDFVKAAGGTLTVEPGFKLQGNTLTTVTSLSATEGKHKLEASTAPGSSFHKQGASEVKMRGQARPLFHINRAGNVSTGVVMNAGKAYLPLADVVKAFGGGIYTPGTLKPGQSINLTFTVNGDGILAVQP